MNRAEQSGFRTALQGGLITAGGVAVGLLVTFAFFGVMAPTTDGMDLIISVASFLLFAGSAFIGAILGMAAGRWSKEPRKAAFAGLIVGAIGHLLIVLVTFVGLWFVVLQAEGDPGAIERWRADGVDRLGSHRFGIALLFMIPSAITAAVVSAATSRPEFPIWLTWRSDVPEEPEFTEPPILPPDEYKDDWE